MKNNNLLNLCCLFTILVSCTTMPSEKENKMDLSGQWQFKLDPTDLGLKGNWSHEKFANTIHLPGTTDEAKIGPMGPETPNRIGVLTRRHEYLGAAWYQKEVTIPSTWANKNISFYMERVMWQSQVWIDGQKVVSVEESLSTPHLHALGKLSAGKHVITMMIDNRMIYPIGNKNHGYGEQTQSRWNGAIGVIALFAHTDSKIDSVRVFSKVNGSIDLEVHGSNIEEGLTVRAKVIDPKSNTVMGSSETVAAKENQHLTFKCNDVVAWSEFTPTTYLAITELVKDGKVINTFETVCGFYNFSHDGNKLLVNGKEAYMRGNLDCVHFVKTGYPSPYKKDWIKIFRKYKEHNLNHVRFHSWCPPKAAFEAADEMGMYLQAEGPIWIDWWMTKPNDRPEMDCEGYPQGIGKSDRTLDQFARAEFRKILDEYGNHPSFMYFCFGNELGTSNFKVTGEWIKEYKAYDPRHLYAASAARTITPYCDFNATHAISGLGWLRQHYEFGTNWDYEKLYSQTTVPILAHEIGQWPVYPKWSIIEKFTGVLRNTRLEKMRNQAKTNGVFDDQEAFTKASGAVNQRMYKDEIEAFLRTPSCRGFQLLSMQDFQGQGEAYVGWLDCFWDDKGTTDPKVFRGYCDNVVALAKLKTYIYKDGEIFTSELLIRNDGASDLKGQVLTASLKDAKGKVIASQTYTVDIAKSKLVTVGTFSSKLVAGEAQAVTFELKLSGKEEVNTYPLWIYPSVRIQQVSDVIVTNKFDAATIQALNDGKKVLLKAHKLGEKSLSKNAHWRPLYWSVPFFPGQGSDTLGLVVRNTHPAFANFPTPEFNDWNWYRICQGAHGFDITGKVPVSYKPIAQPVTDFHINKKLATLFELKIGKGKLFISGYDLNKPLPEVEQLKLSILNYMGSASFNPTQTLSVKTLQEMFKFTPPAPTATPKGFEKAIFYVNAGGKVSQSGQSDWIPALDDVKIASGVSYTVKSEGIWADNQGVAWFGTEIAIDFKLPDSVLADIYIHFHDWNNNGRRGSIVFEGRKYELGDHSKDGKWVKLMVMREDANDGKLELRTTVSKGPNLMITAIAIVPKD